MLFSPFLSKTIGIDLKGLKNEIGLFNPPDLLIIDVHYLQTLSKRELRSGMAELLKHGLIADASLWAEMKELVNNYGQSWQEWVKRSALIKVDVVQQDPTEKGLRKILNFGHTIGHAIETHFMDDKSPLLHGEAVAMGMICESWLSCKINNLPENQYEEIASNLANSYPMREIPESIMDKILSLMLHDKKNENDKIRCALLKTIGSCSYDHELEHDLVKESLRQLNKYSKIEKV